MVEDVPRRDLFIKNCARDAEQRRHDENDRRHQKIVRPEKRAADRGGHDRGDPRDGREDQEFYPIDVRQAHKIGHGILGRAGDQIKNEQKAVALLPVLQEPHGLQLILQPEDPQDTRADPLRHDQNNNGPDDIPQQAQRKAAEPAPYQPCADLYRLRGYKFDHRLQNAERNKHNNAPDPEAVDPCLEAVRVFDQFDRGLSEVQVHVNARADNGQHRNDDQDAQENCFFLFIHDWIFFNMRSRSFCTLCRGTLSQGEGRHPFSGTVFW